MTIDRFETAGLTLSVSDAGGDGRPVIFQHGLCADAGQPSDVFPDDPRLRRITLECRGHGRSPAGDCAQLSIAAFAEDLASFIRQRQLAPIAIEQTKICETGGGAYEQLRIDVDPVRPNGGRYDRSLAH